MNYRLNLPKKCSEANDAIERAPLRDFAPSGYIVSMPKAGGAETVLATGDVCYYLVADESHVHWADCGGDPMSGFEVYGPRLDEDEGKGPGIVQLQGFDRPSQ